MICKTCQAEIIEGSKFCASCGKKVPQPKPPVPEIADELIIRQIDPVLDVKQAAQLLQVSRWMIYELCNQKKIPFFQIGNRKRFVAKDLLGWAANQDGSITTAG